MKWRIIIVLAFLLVVDGFSFDHSFKNWDALLKSYVSSQNGGKTTSVNYGELAKSVAALDAVLKELSAVSLAEYNGWNKDQKIAFLVNSYNAFTWKLILDHYPVKSIKKIGGWGSPWKIEFFTLLGKKRHLDWVEHGKLRKEFKEPRVHFALNCASFSCPPLRQEAYTAKKLNGQFEEQVKAFLSNTKETSFNIKDKTIRVSKIFDWFEEDFGGSEEAVIDWLKGYLPGIRNMNDLELEYGKYNWNLNGK